MAASAHAHRILSDRLAASNRCVRFMRRLHRRDAVADETSPGVTHCTDVRE
jgi:hypothetical protein